MQTKKLEVGQDGFVIWPGVQAYDIFKQAYDFDKLEFRVLKVKICDRRETKVFTDGIAVPGWAYKICLANKKDVGVFNDGGDPRSWDKPFYWDDFIGETSNEAVKAAYQENNKMVDGFLMIARGLESLIDPNENKKVEYYNPKRAGKLL